MAISQLFASKFGEARKEIPKRSLKPFVIPIFFCYQLGKKFHGKTLITTIRLSSFTTIPIDGRPYVGFLAFIE